MIARWHNKLKKCKTEQDSNGVALHSGPIDNIIGVNHPAIVREIPHFDVFLAFPHFPRTSRIFGFILRTKFSY